MHTVAAGYLLQTDTGQVDAAQFRRHVVQARDLVDRSALQEAASELRAGLSFWRGEVLAGVEAPYVWVLRASTQEERISAANCWRTSR